MKYSSKIALIIATAVALAGVRPLPLEAAEITSDHPAAVLVFPKILVDTEGADGRLDTFVTISNVSTQPINVLCYYVNATPVCPTGNGECFPENTCSVACLPQWQQTDFRFRLTREQPTGWLASVGAGVGCDRLGRCSDDGVLGCEDNQDCTSPARCVFAPCLPLDGGIPGGFPGQTNEGSLIPPSPEDPFIGELKCIAVDETGAPTDRNDLVGRAMIGFLRADGEYVDVAGYNPIGFPAIEGANNRDLTLILGGPSGENPDQNPADAECLAARPSTCAEYAGCPNILILDHYFDGAIDSLALNRCLPDGTCAVSGGPCATDGECLANVCDANICTVSGDACAVDEDCENVCDDATERCTLSGTNCGPLGSECEPATMDVRVITEITMVPCTQDFEEGIPSPQPGESGSPASTQVQFLVFNEFEQRFSTSTTLTCFDELPLSAIDTSQPERSIFSAGVGGTLTGQTRMRGAISSNSGGKARGNTLVAIAEEFRCSGPIWEFPSCNFISTGNLVSSAAKNFHFQGRRPQSDYIYLPLQ